MRTILTTLSRRMFLAVLSLAPAATAQVGLFRQNGPSGGLSPEDNRLLFSSDPSVGWLDVAGWPHAFRLARLFGRIE